jgi:outer membrane protein TolC
MKLHIYLLALLIGCGTVWAQETQTSEADVHNLSLKQAVDLALKNNLEITIEQYNPELRDTDIKIQEAKFEPLFSSSILTTDATRPTGSLLVGEQASFLSKTFDYNFSLNQQLKTGTFYELAFNNQRLNTTNSFSSFNPSFDTSLFATIRQPLMRNFGLDITKAPIHIAEKNRLTADQRLRVKMMDIVLQTEKAYWDLKYAIANLDVMKQSLASAQDLYENNKKQVEVGTMAPLEIVVAEAEVAAREEDIINAQVLILNTEDQLKNLMFSDKGRRFEGTYKLTDEPAVEAVSISEEDAIKQALANNPDLKAVTTDLESRKLSTKIAQNAMRPQFDLQASLGYAGLGGNTVLYDNTTFPPTPIQVVPGGYSDALSRMFDNRTWSVGFVFGLPIGNKNAEANYVRADLSEKQGSVTLEDTKQKLMLAIRNTIRNLQADIKKRDAARASVVLQEKKLDAERKKLSVGLSTNHVVLDFQDDLAQSQQQELLAILDYKRDSAQLQRYMGTILP